jgi:hypothetical protein
MAYMHRLPIWLSSLLALGIMSCAQPMRYANRPIPNGINQGIPTVIGTLQVSGAQVFVDGTPASTGSPIYDGSRVVTGSSSSCLVDLEGGGSIQLDENTDPLFTLLKQGFCILIEIGSGQVFEDTPGQCIRFKTPDGSANSDTKVNIDLRSGRTAWTVAHGEVRLNPPVSYVVRPYEQVTVSHQRIVERRRVTPAELANITAWRRKYFRVRPVTQPPFPPPPYSPPPRYSPPPTPAGTKPPPSTPPPPPISSFTTPTSSP